MDNENTIDGVPTVMGESVQLGSPAWGPPVMSREFIRRAKRKPAPVDPDEATAETVRDMCQCIKTSAADPLVKLAADTAVKQYAMGGPLWAMRGMNPFGDRATRDQAIAEACWWYAKHQLRFVHHQKQIEVWFGERHHLQLLISPDVLVRFPYRMEGDCAIFTMLLCAMLQTLGVQTEIVTVAWDPAQPDIFLHVYPRAVLPDGSRLALDASHGKYPGWSIPDNRRTRVAVWDLGGSIKEDAGERRFQGLHAYRMRGFGQVDVTDTGSIDTSGGLNPSLVYSPPSLQDQISQDFSSLQTSAAGNMDTSQGSFNTDPTTGITTFTPSAAAPAGTPSGIVAPAQNNTAAWANFATQLGKAGMTLAEINAIQPGTLVSPNGQILRQATGYPIIQPSTAAAFGLTGTSMALIGGAALLLLVFVMNKR